MVSLTPCSVARILQSELLPGNSEPPVLQVIKVLEDCDDKFCVWYLSDGQYHLKAALQKDSEMYRVLSRTDQTWAVMQLLAWSLGTLRGPEVVVMVRDLNVVGTASGMLGTPTSWQLMQAKAARSAENPYQELQTPQKRALPERALSPIASSPKRWTAPPRAEVRSLPLMLVPIAQLGVCTQRWRIKARVTSKSGLRSYTNQRGLGKLFSIELQDRGAMTRATFFNGAAEKFYAQILVKGIYEFSGGTVKPGNPRYCPYPVEITLDEKSVVTSLEDDGSIPAVAYDFVRLDSLGNLNSGAVIDVLAVVTELSEVSSIKTRLGETRQKRRATIVDESSTSCAMTLWGDRATDPLELGAVVLVQGAKLSEFGGRCLDVSETGHLDVNPDDQRAFKLLQWHQEHRHEPVKAMSGTKRAGGRRKFLSEVKYEDSQLITFTPGVVVNPSSRSVNVHRVSPVTVMSIPHERPIWYEACTVLVQQPDGKEPRSCRKKVVGGRCSANHDCENPAVVYMLRVQVADATTGTVWLRAFGEQAEAVMGVPASTIAALFERAHTGDVEAWHAYNRIFSAAVNRRWTVQLRSRMESYEGKERASITLEQCEPVDFAVEGMEMLKSLRRMIRLA